MSYDISIDDVSKVIHITWSGVLDFSVLKRYLLSFNYHISHTGYRLMYDFREVNEVNLDSTDLPQLAELSRQVFDPLLKNTKVVMLIDNYEIVELFKLFTNIRIENSDSAPQYCFFEDDSLAINWLQNDQ